MAKTRLPQEVLRSLKEARDAPVASALVAGRNPASKLWPDHNPNVIWIDRRGHLDVNAEPRN